MSEKFCFLFFVDYTLRTKYKRILPFIFLKIYLIVYPPITSSSKKLISIWKEFSDKKEKSIFVVFSLFHQLKILFSIIFFVSNFWKSKIYFLVNNLSKIFIKSSFPINRFVFCRKTFFINFIAIYHLIKRTFIFKWIIYHIVGDFIYLFLK